MSYLPAWREAWSSSPSAVSWTRAAAPAGRGPWTACPACGRRCRGTRPQRPTVCCEPEPAGSGSTGPATVHIAGVSAFGSGIRFPNNNNNNNSGYFCKAVYHREGWAYHALQDQQKCVHKNSKIIIYEHNAVFLTHPNCTPTHRRIVMGLREVKVWGGGGYRKQKNLKKEGEMLQRDSVRERSREREV